MFIFNLNTIPRDLNFNLNSFNKQPIIIKYLSNIILEKDLTNNIKLEYNDNKVEYQNYKIFYYLVGYYININQISVKLNNNENLIINLNDDIELYFIDYLFPFYGGKYENLHTINYFNNLFFINFQYFDNNLFELPSEISNHVGYESKRVRIYKINNIIKNKLSEKDFIKLIIFKLNTNTINDLHKIYNIPIIYSENLKNNLSNKNFNFDIDFNINLLIIIGYLFSNNYFNFRIYDYNNYHNNFKDIIFNQNLIKFKKFYQTPNNKLYKIKKY